MPEEVRQLYDPTYDAWPDLELGRVVLAPVRVGVDRRTGRMIVGWKHVVQSMSVIFATRFHERVLRRWVGSFVPHLLGESGTMRVITRFYWAIASAIDLWEPCFRVRRIRVARRGTSGDETDALTSADELRSGQLTTRNEGVYVPRGHLGDPTPEAQRTASVIGSAGSLWEVVP